MNIFKQQTTTEAKTRVTLNRYYDYEDAPSLFETQAFKDYKTLIISVFRPDEWLTIGQMHKRLGKKNVIRKWTLDALEQIGYESRLVKPTRYRIKI
jgi:hypothetical protein